MHFYRGSGQGAARYFDEAHERGSGAYYDEHGQAVVQLDAWCEGQRVATPAAIERGDLIKWVEGVDLATGEAKGVIRSGGEQSRQPLRFVEMVVNNPKSLSIVASQNQAVAAALDRMLDRQADAIAKYLSSVAVTRVGPRGGQTEVGSLTLETARVTHMTSREGDPHAHIHLMANARVQTPDGTWHGLHSASLRQHIGAIHERAQRVLVTDQELHQVLAREGYTLGADGEINEAREAVGLLSKRAAMVESKRRRIEAEWREAHPGTEPSQRVINAWRQEAWAEDRPTKPQGERETPEQLAERVRLELAEAGFDFATSRAEVALVAVSVGQVDRDQLAEEAVAVLSANKSTWSTADLTAAVEAAVTRSGVVGDPQAVSELAEDVASRATDRCVSVLDPEIYTPTSMSRHLTSQGVIDADMALNVGLAGLAGGDGERDRSGEVLALDQGLDAGQGAAVAAVCGTRRLEVVIGPAGTGKTAMLSVAKARLDAQGRDLVVLAPTRKAAQVAAFEVGVDGASVSKLLHDYGWRWDELGRWSRLAPGQEDPVTGTICRGPRSQLSATSVVVVDEAALMTVDQANALIDVVSVSGAALRLIGDQRQLGAVGRGGVMETASRWVEGGPVTLDEVHRFLRVGVDAEGMPVTEIDAEYAELSLRLREGVEPDSVADELIERGQVVIHESEAEAVEAIAEQVAAAADPEALAVTVATNEEARALNEAVRTRRVTAGEVDDKRTVQGRDGERVGVGDWIVTRQNSTDRDVANREAWSVEKITKDGTVVVRGTDKGNKDRRAELDAAYVAENVQLGYAVTDYGNQGVTDERSVTWVTNATTSGGLYVGATRGRYENTLHVVADDAGEAHDMLVAAMARDRADRGLDAARAQAEAEAEATRRRVVDPATWRSDEEIKAAATALKNRYDAELAKLSRVIAKPEDVIAQENQADQVAADAARHRAEEHRADAERARAGRGELLKAVTADYFQAREDARIVAAGPGRFERKAAMVQEAHERYAETARRWDARQLPGAQWSDDVVRQQASSDVDRIIDTNVRRYISLAMAEERTMGSHERAIDARNWEQEQARALDAQRAAARDALSKDTYDKAAKLAKVKAWRDEQVKTMTPEEVAAADEARDALLATQQQKCQKVAAQQQARQQEAERHYQPPPPPGMEQAGPELGL